MFRAFVQHGEPGTQAVATGNRGLWIATSVAVVVVLVVVALLVVL